MGASKVNAQLRSFPCDMATWGRVCSCLQSILDVFSGRCLLKLNSITGPRLQLQLAHGVLAGVRSPNGWVLQGVQSQIYWLIVRLSHLAQ